LRATYFDFNVLSVKCRPIRRPARFARAIAANQICRESRGTRALFSGKPLELGCTAEQ
jgi:hypothetical protein